MQTISMRNHFLLGVAGQTNQSVAQIMLVDLLWGRPDEAIRREIGP